MCWLQNQNKCYCQSAYRQKFMVFSEPGLILWLDAKCQSAWSVSTVQLWQKKIQSRNFCKSIKPGQLPDICHGCHRKVSRALWPEWWVVTSVKLVNLGGYGTTRNHLPPIRNSLERLKNVRMLWDFGILKVSLDPRKVSSYAQNILIHVMVSLL